MWKTRVISTLAAAALLAGAGCDGQAEKAGKPAGNKPAVTQAVTGQFSAVTQEVRYPTHLAQAADGTLYVSDALAGKVYGYKDNVRVSELTNLDKPLGLAVAGNQLYVGSQGRGTVEVYDLTTEKYVRSLDAKFKMPAGIAVAPDGVVYVADSLLNNVQAFSADGAPMMQFTGLKFPSAVAVDATRVVVGDQGNYRLVVFNRDGKVLSTIGEAVKAEATSVEQFKGRFTRIQDVALRGEEVLVLDSYHAHIQVLGLDGTSKGFLGQKGLGLSLGIAIDAAGNVLASDPENKRWVAIAQETK